MSAAEYTAALSALTGQLHDTLMQAYDLIGELDTLDPRHGELHDISRLVHVATDLASRMTARAREERDADQPVSFTVSFQGWGAGD